MTLPDSSDRLVRLGLVAALLVGIAVRVLPVVSSPLPLGDGGLFWSMVEDIRANGLLPPGTTHYNGIDIPFLYPPLGLLAAAFIGEFSGASTLDVIRFMPLLAGIGCLVAFAGLSRQVLPPVAATGAVLGYALMPHAFDWVIAGGGLTRGLGLLPALVAMSLAARGPLVVRTAITVGVLLGLSALMHPQTPVFGAIGCAVLAFPSRPPFSRWLSWLAGVGLVSFLVALLWLAPSAISSGTLPLTAAAHRLDPIGGLIRSASLEFSGAAFMDLVTPLALIGLLVSVVGRSSRLPILVGLVYLSGAGGGDFLGAVAWALLAGSGFAAVLHAARELTPTREIQPATGIAVATVGMTLAVASVLGSSIHEQSKLQSLSPDQASAMRWVAAATDTDAEFLVTTVDTWGNDEVSEWFPALAERRSLGTVQGSEWLGADRFSRQESVHIALVHCIGSTATCYRSAAEDAGAPGAYLFIPKGSLAGPLGASDCCPAVRETLASAGYEILYDGVGATIGRPAD